MRSHFHRLALVAGFVLIASACGSTSTTEGDTSAAGDADAPVDDSEGSTDGGADDPGVGDGEDDTAGPGGDSGELSASEITELLFPSFEESDRAALQAQFEDEERERQRLIVECMAGQGFEYVPVDFGGGISFGPGGDLDPSSREFAEEYGLGFSTFQDEAFEEGPGDFVDPNQEYVESLSDSARDAYYETLHGSGPEFDPSMTEDEINAQFEENPELFAPQGCEGEAYQQASTFGQAEQVWTEFGDQLNELYERVQADPRIVDVESEWVGCMADKGHAYGAMNDMYEDLGNRMNELYGGGDFVDPFAGMTEEEIEAQIDSLTEEELNDLFGGPEIDDALLAEIQEYEIGVAVDSFDCGGTNQSEVFEEVFGEYQQEFIEQNIDGIRAALAGSG